MMSTQQRSTHLSLLGSLLLATLHYTAGIAILLLASWFIAACAIAGANFNYVLPAVVIRALALLRIGSGYFALLVGHHDLLTRLANLRDQIFAALQGQTQPLRGEALDAMNYNSERVAAVWISFVAQHSGILFSLTLLNIVSLLLIPALSLIVLYFSVSFFILYTLLLISLLNSAKQVVAIKREQQLALHQHIESANLWHMQTPAQIKLPSLDPVMHVLNQQQRQIKFATLLLLLFSVATISVLVTQFSHTMLGNALFVVIPMALLSVNDWLAPSLPNQQTLLEYVQAKRALASQRNQRQQMTRLDYPIHAISLNSFKASATPMPHITAVFKPRSLNIVIGSSGAGKSRLLQAIAGLIPSEGSRTLHCAAQDVGEIQVQQGLLNDSLYIEQFPYCLSDTLQANLQIANPLASTTQMQHAINQVGLAYLSDNNEWLGDAGRPLSGGELKRLGIARALLSDAAVLLIDEPFEGLDDNNTKRIARLLNTLAKTKTVVISTHIIPVELSIDSLLSLDTPSLAPNSQQQTKPHDDA